MHMWRVAVNPRLNPTSPATADALKAMLGLQRSVETSGLEPSLINLVKTRASQINGCAYCIAMHTTDARKQGETDERLHLLNAWHESPIYTARERAALAWTEALTRIIETHAPDDAFEQVRAQFSEKEIADLTLAIIAINGWNRIYISYRLPPQLTQSHAIAAE